MIVSSAELPPSKNAVATDTNLLLKHEILLGILLFVLGLLSRLPFAGQVLYNWDSINFAQSLQHFDVAVGQPHIPGYILYVFLGQLINSLVNNPQLTLVGISIVSSGLAVAILYGLGRSMFDQKIGLLAALLLASSPLFWFYGEIGLPHSLDAFAVILAVWLLYLVKQGRAGLALPAAIWLAVAGGLRPQTELFLIPLALYACWQLNWWRRLLAVGILIVFNLAWIIPLFWLSGGPARYFEIMSAFITEFNATTSIFNQGGLFGLSRNLTKLVLYTLFGWSLAFVPLLILIALKAKNLTRPIFSSTLKDVRFWFMLLWICPALAYYILVHMGQQGLVFVYLPAFMLLSAVGIYAFKWPQPLYRQIVMTILIVGNTLIFLLAPAYPLNTDRVKLLTADTLRQHDAFYRTRIESMSQYFPETQTLLLSSGWRFPQYYLPHYLLAPYGIVARWEWGEGSPTRTGEIWVDGAQAGLTPDKDGFFYVILFDDELIPFNQSPDRQEWLELPHDQKLVYLRFTAAERFYIGPQSFGIVPAP